MDQDDFDCLLSWLHPDRDEAGKKYEQIRRKLIAIFTCRGRANAEDLADVVITRVVKKACELMKTYDGDPALYFYGVARKVLMEPDPKPNPRLIPAPDPPSNYKELIHKCLEECMRKLPPKVREEVLEYYSKSKSEKIAHRKKMADELGVNPNALRIKMHRIRALLRECISDLLKEMDDV
jgi:DNA-directed RNA polymerase specialized sigma24 family protein